MSDIENNDSPVNEEQEPEPELLKTKKAKAKGKVLVHFLLKGHL